MAASNNVIHHCLLVAVIGFAYHFLVLMIWGFLPFINPVSNALFDCCVTENWFRGAIWVHDIVVNVLLQMPLAYFLLKLNRKRIALLVCAALLPSLVFWNYHLVWPQVVDDNLLLFLPGLAMEYLSLPIATLIVIAFYIGKKPEKEV